jgi:hypothetical protein
MRNKIVLLILIGYIVALTACSSTPRITDTESTTLPVSSHLPEPSPSRDDSVGAIVLPQSSGGVVFGNRLNNNNIVYSFPDR